MLFDGDFPKHKLRKTLKNVPVQWHVNNNIVSPYIYTYKFCIEKNNR